MKRLFAAEVAGHFINASVFNNGPLEKLIAENDGCLTSKLFTNVCKIMSILNNFTRTYQPQSRGQVERYNRTILPVL